MLANRRSLQASYFLKQAETAAEHMPYVGTNFDSLIRSHCTKKNFHFDGHFCSSEYIRDTWIDTAEKISPNSYSEILVSKVLIIL